MKNYTETELSQYRSILLRKLEITINKYDAIMQLLKAGTIREISPVNGLSTVEKEHLQTTAAKLRRMLNSLTNSLLRTEYRSFS